MCSEKQLGTPVFGGSPRDTANSTALAYHHAFDPRKHSLWLYTMTRIPVGTLSSVQARAVLLKTDVKILCLVLLVYRSSLDALSRSNATLTAICEVPRCI